MDSDDLVDLVVLTEIVVMVDLAEDQESHSKRGKERKLLVVLLRSVGHETCCRRKTVWLTDSAVYAFKTVSQWDSLPNRLTLS